MRQTLLLPLITGSTIAFPKQSTSWKIVSARTLLTCPGAANICSLIVEDGGGNQIMAFSAPEQGAGTATILTWAPCMVDAASINGAVVAAPKRVISIPDEFWIQPQWLAYLVLDLVDVNATFAGVCLQTEIYLKKNPGGTLESRAPQDSA